MLSFFPGRGGGRDRAPRKSPALRQRSLALPRLVEPLESAFERSFSVLDLGPASPANLDFFLKRGARLTVADFAPTRRESLSQLVRVEPGIPFDAVLAWDFLNYLSRERLGRLLGSLEPHFRPGTLIHAFVVTSREMSSVPRRYRIVDRETLLSEAGSERVVPSPRYVEQDLLKCMPGLVVEHRFQLRNGMLEYLFSYRTRLRVAYSATMGEPPRSRPAAVELRPAPSR